MGWPTENTNQNNRRGKVVKSRENWKILTFDTNQAPNGIARLRDTSATRFFKSSLGTVTVTWFPRFTKQYRPTFWHTDGVWINAAIKPGIKTLKLFYKGQLFPDTFNFLLFWQDYVKYTRTQNNKKCWIIFIKYSSNNEYIKIPDIKVWYN